MKVNISKLSKEFCCDYNLIYNLLKQYKVNIEYNQITKDRYIAEPIYNALIKQDLQFKNKVLCLDKLRALKSSNIPLHNRYYLYFLFNEDELIYIGQTCNLIGRIGSHQGDKKFNYVSALPTASTIILAQEAYYIDKYKPKHNMVHTFNNGLSKYIFEAHFSKKINILDL